jgi:flavin reductase (DIM6/NTAB) family NADH-FMN oxidoreductase RutF
MQPNDGSVPEAARGFDGAAFRKVLGNVPTSVSIVTGEDRDGPFGIVIGSLVSISLDPPLVGMFIDNRSRTLARLEECGEICINVLGADHAELCRDFGRRKDERFRCGRWRQEADSPPRLGAALAWISGRIERKIMIGDHHLIVVDPRSLDEIPACLEAEPLIFFRGAFAA